MNVTNPKSTAQIAGHPIHPMLVPFPIAFWAATLFCDVAFWVSGSSDWATAAIWLLGAGIITAALAAVAGLTDFLCDRRIRNLHPAWLHLGGNVLAVLLSLANLYIRYSEGGVAGVLPWGLVISVVVVLLLIFNGWQGWEMVYRHGVGIAAHGGQGTDGLASNDDSRRAA